MTGSALLNDGKGMLYHFNGVEAGDGWANLAVAMRTSSNNGATWSHPRLIQPQHQLRNQVIAGTLLTREGYLVQPCDATHAGRGGTALHISRDGGRTWTDPGEPLPPIVEAGGQGGSIAGIHAGVAQLADGSLLAFGRGLAIGGKLACSRSSDWGKTWTYSASEFPPIGGGQRLVLRRLAEGPLLLMSFTGQAMEMVDAAGRKAKGQGLFAAISFDDGKTWPIRRLMTDSAEPRTLNGAGWTQSFTLDAEHAEPKGYLAATQTPDGVIHLLSSGLYYRFNLAWLKSPMPSR